MRDEPGPSLFWPGSCFKKTKDVVPDNEVNQKAWFDAGVSVSMGLPRERTAGVINPESDFQKLISLNVLRQIRWLNVTLVFE